MNILVCVKQVPGSSNVEVDPVTGVLKRDGVASKMNPYDLYGIELALDLVEAHGGTVETSKAAKIDPGYLAVRYYKNDSNQQYTYQTGPDRYVARAMTALYGRGFYVGLYAGLEFSLEPAAGSAKTVTVTVSLYRDAERTDRVFSDQLIVDLRQTPPVKTAVTAVVGA